MPLLDLTYFSFLHSPGNAVSSSHSAITGDRYRLATGTRVVIGWMDMVVPGRTLGGHGLGLEGRLVDDREYELEEWASGLRGKLGDGHG